jgi:N-acetyl-gamma-glutamyl-phosphate reductase
VFLAMPHVVTAQVAMALFDTGVRIIDLSGDFRLLQLKDYQRDYAPNHPCPERLGTFIYGMPEINAEKIRSATYVACPGCFATAIALGLLPLAHAGWLMETAIRTVGITGSSGSGVKPSAGTHHPVRVNNLKAYKPLNHQHRAEIVQTLRLAGAGDISLDFVPVSAPLARGILAISLLDMPESQDLPDVHARYTDYYRHNPLVSVLPSGMSAEVVAVAGTARVEIALDAKTDEDTGRRTLCCTTAIDNLVKGGAGQAIQCFNLMTGKPVNAGFDKPGLWP